MSKSPHTFLVRIYYEDTDAAGVVYHSNYLKFAERARTEALRLSGLEQSELMREHKIGFAVRALEAEFFKPAQLDDLLTIETAIHDINKVSIHMQQTIRRGEEKLATVAVKLAVVGDQMKLAKLPEFVRKAMLKVFK